MEDKSISNRKMNKYPENPHREFHWFSNYQMYEKRTKNQTDLCVKKTITKTNCNNTRCEMLSTIKLPHKERVFQNKDEIENFFPVQLCLN